MVNFADLLGQYSKESSQSQINIYEEKLSQINLPEYLEELKLRVDIAREELEKQIHEHIHRSYDRED